MYIYINAMSWCFDLNMFKQNACFFSKLGLEVHVEHAYKSNLKT